MPKRELFISVDTETSGQMPSVGSLLQIGACVMDQPDHGFKVYLKPLADRPWSDEAEAVHRLSREFLAEHGEEPETAMRQFAAWLDELSEEGHVKLVFVGFNATFDWAWVADYFWRYLGRNPFGISGMDLKSYAMGKHDLPRWADTAKRNLRKRYPTRLAHSHDALDDAVEQAELGRDLRTALPTTPRQS